MEEIARKKLEEQLAEIRTAAAEYKPNPEWEPEREEARMLRSRLVKDPSAHINFYGDFSRYLLELNQKLNVQGDDKIAYEAFHIFAGSTPPGKQKAFDTPNGDIMNFVRAYIEKHIDKNEK